MLGLHHGEAALQADNLLVVAVELPCESAILLSHRDDLVAVLVHVPEAMEQVVAGRLSVTVTVAER